MGEQRARFPRAGEGTQARCGGPARPVVTGRQEQWMGADGKGRLFAPESRK